MDNYYIIFAIVESPMFSLPDKFISFRWGIAWMSSVSQGTVSLFLGKLTSLNYLKSFKERLIDYKREHSVFFFSKKGKK